MKDEIPVLVKRLESEGLKIITFFNSVNENQLKNGVYSGMENWDVKDIIAHLVSSERSFLELFENIKNGGQGIITKLDIDQFNFREVKKLKESSIVTLLSEFKRTRSQMVNWVNHLTEADLQKSGNHPAMGFTSLISMIRMVYIHDSMHLRDVAQAINLKIN